MFNVYTFEIQANAAAAVVDEGTEVAPSELRPEPEPQPPHHGAAAMLPTLSPPTSIGEPDAGQLLRPASAVIDTLTQELSRQNLQLDALASASSMHPPSPPTIDMPNALPWPGLEVDDTVSPDAMSLDTPSPGPVTSDDQLSSPAPDPLRYRLQMDAEIPNNPSNPSRIQSMMEDMVATGSQCNIQPAPLPGPPAPGPPPKMIIEGPVLEVDPRHDSLGTHIQVDDELRKQSEADEDLAWRNELLALRRARQGGMARRVRYANGIVIYQGAQDTAFRCENVVKTRIRMRKRDRDRKGPKSLASSVANSSVASSPVIPPSLPSPQMQPSLPLYLPTVPDTNQPNSSTQL